MSACLRCLPAAGLVALLWTTQATATPSVPLIQDPPPTPVERLGEADDDLLPVRPRAGRQDDLLDPYPQPPAPAETARSARPDPAGLAGRGAALPLDGRFEFDLVIGFHASTPDAGLLQSFFFMDSRSGHFGMDRDGLESLGQQVAAGDGGRFVFQVFTPAADHYSYLVSNEIGPIAMRIASGMDVLGADFEAYAAGDHFERHFRPTGRVRDIGRNLAGKPYPSVEYAGASPETGTPVSLWLARPDFQVGFYAGSYYGLGVVTLPGSREQFLVTRMEGEGAVFELSYIKRERNHFSGAGYRDVSGVMPGPP